MQLLAYWGLLLSACCYAALAVWRLAIARDHAGSLYLGLAFGGMACWTFALWFDVPWLILAGEIMRDVGWLAYFLGTTRSFEQQDEVRRTILLFSVSLLGLVVARTVLSVATLDLISGGAKTTFELILGTQWLYALIGIFYASYLYRATASSAASGFRLISVSLGALWA